MSVLKVWNGTQWVDSVGSAELPPTGAEGEVLTVVGGVPDWAPPSGGDVSFSDLPHLVSSQYADLQTAMNAAAASAPSGKEGGRLFVVPGVHEVDATLIVPEAVTVFSTAAQAGEIKVSATFPTNTPVVQLGAESTMYEHGIILQDIGIDCNNIAGSTGIYTRVAQESSLIDRVMIHRFRKHGIHAWGDGSTYEPNHLEIRDTQLFGSPSGAPLSGIEANYLGMPMVIRRTTVFQDVGSPIIPKALHATDCDVYLDTFHVERSTVGVHVEHGASFRGGLYGRFITGHSTVGTVVLISDEAKIDIGHIRDAGATQTIDYTVNWRGGTRTLTGFVSHFSTVQDRTVQAPDAGALINGKWDGPHLVMNAGGGDHHLWIDVTNSKLRLKMWSAPTSETDGTVIGP